MNGELDDMDKKMSQIDMGMFKTNQEMDRMSQEMNGDLDDMDKEMSQIDMRIFEMNQELDRMSQEMNGDLDDIDKEMSQIDIGIFKTNEEINGDLDDLDWYMSQIDTDQEMNTDSDIPLELLEEYQAAINETLPKKSLNRYTQAYDVFIKWQASKGMYSAF